MDLNCHPYETKIEEALEKALATSSEKAKAKRTTSAERVGGSIVTASALEAEKMNRFDGFIRK